MGPIQLKGHNHARSVFGQQLGREGGAGMIGETVSPGIDQNEIVILLQHFRHAQPAEGALLEAMQQDELGFLTTRTVVVMVQAVGRDPAL
jgi:hypothetical protein